MSVVMDKETHTQFAQRMGVEHRELVREIKAGNYLRAAGIARYISDELVKHNEVWKEGRP